MRDLTPRFSFQKSDEGWFECQISSTPIISHLVYLDIAGEKGPTLSIELLEYALFRQCTGVLGP